MADLKIPADQHLSVIDYWLFTIETGERNEIFIMKMIESQFSYYICYLNN
jgi:hypothetical protein